MITKIRLQNWLKKSNNRWDTLDIPKESSRIFKHPQESSRIWNNGRKSVRNCTENSKIQVQKSQKYQIIAAKSSASPKNPQRILKNLWKFLNIQNNGEKTDNCTENSKIQLQQSQKIQITAAKSSTSPKNPQESSRILKNPSLKLHRKMNVTPRLHNSNKSEMSTSRADSAVQWPVDQLTSWPADQLTSWPADPLATRTSLTSRSSPLLALEISFLSNKNQSKLSRSPLISVSSTPTTNHFKSSISQII